MIDPILLQGYDAQISVKKVDSASRIMIHVPRIICIEKIPASHYVKIHYITNDGKVRDVTTRGKVGDFARILPRQFVRANNFLVINLCLLSEYTNTGGTLLYRGFQMSFATSMDLGCKINELDFR